jgi:hypothetical protein
MTYDTSSVRLRANGICEYCRVSDYLARATSVFNVEHIVPRAHWDPSAGDVDNDENLAWGCWKCNRGKSAKVDGEDPDTGLRASLYHPRTDEWDDAFVPSPSSGRIDGQTPSGRVTSTELAMNAAERIETRVLLNRFGLWPVRPSTGLSPDVIAALATIEIRIA